MCGDRLHAGRLACPPGLGPRGDAQGEFCIEILVDGVVPHGWVKNHETTPEDWANQQPGPARINNFFCTIRVRGFCCH